MEGKRSAGIEESLAKNIWQNNVEVYLGRRFEKFQKWRKLPSLYPNDV